MDRDESSTKLLGLRLQLAACGDECTLPPHVRHLVMVMALLGDSATGEGLSGQATIARAMGYSVRKVRRLMAELEAAEGSPVSLTRQARQRDEGRGRTSDRYRLALAGPTGSPVPVGDSTNGIPSADCSDDQAARMGRPSGTDGTTKRIPCAEDLRSDPRSDPRSEAAAADQAPLPGIPTLSEREQKALEALESEPTIGPRIRKREQLVKDLCAERPDLDVAGAIRAAGRWCRSNPTRAPKTGFPRFLLTWVKNEGRGPKRTNGRGRPAPQGADADAAELERIRKQSEAVKAQRRKAATA